MRTKACVHTLNGHTNTVADLFTQAPDPQVDKYSLNQSQWFLLGAELLRSAYFMSQFLTLTVFHHFLICLYRLLLVAMIQLFVCGTLLQEKLKQF